MGCLRKCFNVAANSILESVIALCIISICLSAAVMVYAMVFNPSNSVHFYKTQNKANALFYILQVDGDSLLAAEGNKLQIEDEAVGRSRLYSLKYADSIGKPIEKQFYILPDE